MKVRNMISSRGNAVPNQFVIEEVQCIISYPEKLGKKEMTGLGDMFQSYSSNITFKTSDQIYLDYKYWDYSVTTGEYRNQFLGETKKETQAKIDQGIYKLVDLN